MLTVWKSRRADGAPLTRGGAHGLCSTAVVIGVVTRDLARQNYATGASAFPQRADVDFPLSSQAARVVPVACAPRTGRTLLSLLS